MKKIFLFVIPCVAIAIASFLLAIVMLTSCSNVAKKSIEDLTVENIQCTLLHPDDKCIGAYPRLITQDFWLSQVYRDDVNCCICVQDGDLSSG